VSRIDVVVGAVQLRAPPEVFSRSGDAVTVSFDFLAMGEVIRPRGRRAYRATWKGTHFGSAFNRMPWLGSGADPDAASAQLYGYLESGEEVTLRAGGLTMPVYVAHYSDDLGRGSGFGNRTYDITLIEVRPISQGSGTTAGSGGSASNGATRTAREAPRTYTTRQDDTPASVARTTLNDETQWRAIVAANPSMPTLTDGTIPAGTVLTIPRPGTPTTVAQPDSEAQPDSGAT
jgi:hypothetical protein